jgi:uncharacterized lipoprotein YddW (UPF0748 family)
MFRPRNILFILLVAILVWRCKDDDVSPDTFDAGKYKIIADKKEIRAAWITTVGNYDWPITKGNPDAQKSELTKQLTKCKDLNFNAVILQVRPVADAFYPSALEPWSVYLTGVQGQDPGYDPMQYAIDESHRLGMEFHAWLNPYRVGATSAVLSPDHVAMKNPSWIVVFQNQRYFNPGMPEVRAHLVSVVKDIVTRYDVDAIHFDDYFYPYGAKSTSNPFGFDDREAFEKYGKGKDLHEWRAENVNLMVAEVYQAIKSVKPGVLFGISPSGRRENSVDLYADPLVWLQNKWVDYLAPQIYWEFGHTTADFGKQAQYWNANSFGVPIVVGIAAYKFKDSNYPAFGNVNELDRQIEEVRYNSNLYGCFYFRMKFLENATLYNFLKEKYVWKSVLPLMGKATVPTVGPPSVWVSGKDLNWATVPGAKKYAVYLLERDTKKSDTFLAHCVQINAEQSFSGTSGKSYFVKALNEDQAESVRSEVVTVN